MEVFDSVKAGGKDIVSVRAYKGDAMTFLCFDLDASKLQDLTGFSIRIRFSNKKYFLFNRIQYDPAIIAKNNLGAENLRSSEFSPFQKFNWVHVPTTNHLTGKPFYGEYTYEVTPRYLINEILQPVDASLTVTVKIDLSPYKYDGPGGEGPQSWVHKAPLPASEEDTQHVVELVREIETSGRPLCGFIAESMPSVAGTNP